MDIPKLQELMQKLNLDQEKTSELLSTLKSNPTQLPQKLKELNITPEIMAQLSAIMMAAPDVLKNAAAQMGIDSAQVDSVLNSVKGRFNQDKQTPSGDNSTKEATPAKTAEEK